MKKIELFENVIFNDSRPNAEPLHVDEHGRILRFALQPGQAVTEHKAPHSPVNIVILEGQGLFAGSSGVKERFGPETMLLFNPGETHSIEALDEPLVFLVILHEAPNPNK